MTGTRVAAVDPIVLEIVEGTLHSIEAEVEVAIERTARSPMIRDQHDYRAGIHDRHCRKLTGRSYSAMVDPVVRDFPIDSMQEGDVYYHNDVYLSEGSIGHLPDLCTTVPAFYQGRVVAFVQAFGHHDDIGGMVPGSMPAHATSVYQEGLLIPPVRLYHAGVRNHDVHRIIFRNSRLPDSYEGDVDGEVAACRMGAARVTELFERYGTPMVEACFEAILERCREAFRREIFPKIPNGTYTWEDYVEHDGVDPPRLHRLRMTMSKTPGKLILDLNGTGPQAKGPINHAGNYAQGRFLKKWIAVALRNLADTPERAADLDINEGICDLIEIVFPPPGTLISPRFPAPTNARTFAILRLIGIFAGVLAHAVDGRMPADQETIRYWGIHGFDDCLRAFLMREVLGGGSGGRWYADGSDVIHIVPDSKNLPVEFAETRFPLRVEKLGLAQDSGGAGMRRGGLGYDKHVRVLQDCYFISTADRTILSCYGVRGGRAGAPYSTTVNPGAPSERTLPGLVDDHPLRRGDLVRIQTTGGGGWGDPLEREPEMVRLDVLRGLVSRAAALRDYGVVLQGDDEALVVDPAATARRREQAHACREPLALIDRGPGYERLRNHSSSEE